MQQDTDRQGQLGNLGQRVPLVRQDHRDPLDRWVASVHLDPMVTLERMQLLTDLLAPLVIPVSPASPAAPMDLTDQ